MKTFQRCTRCVMDNRSDDTITFDAQGHCNYCTEALERMSKVYFPNEEGEKRAKALVEEIKAASKGKKYDCIMGLSGGLDSSYLAYLGYQWGLRVLAVHADDGYDTDISRSNLEKLIRATGFDYEVITPDAEQLNDLTLSFMKAGVPNLAIPQDNVLIAFVYQKCKDYGIKYFLSGSNFALEGILQKGNTHSNSDFVHIKAVHDEFGSCGMDKLRFISTEGKVVDRYFRHIKTERPLNYVDYNRDRAFRELSDFCGFEYYGRKHLENVETAFIQLKWLPEKFNVDKRTSHLSSMIVSNQMTREQALRELEEPMYNPEQMEEYISVIKENMKLSDEDFEKIMSAPTHQHTEYKTEDKTLPYRTLMTLLRIRRALLGR